MRLVLGGAALGIMTAVAVAVPESLLHRGTREARECLAKYTEPRGPETPSCSAAFDSFYWPAKFPWTASRARYRIEELGVRMARFEYVEAAVGKPNREALAHAAEAIDHQEAVVQNGTTRVSMKELGPLAGAPDPGRDADELGDRRTLVERGESWFNWRVRLSALRAALLSGDMAKTEALAKRYAVDDPRDPDLRSAVASVLCMGPDPEKGADMLAFIQDDRASRRYEGLSRDYGEVRALLVACLAKRNLPPPPLPTRSDAGSADAVEQRALLRLRLADTPAAEASRNAAIATIVRLLEGGPRGPGGRLSLLAALLTSGTDLDAAKLVRLSKPKFDELALAPSLSLTALEWVADHRPAIGDAEPAAILPGKVFLEASHELFALQTKLEEAADKPVGKDEPNEGDQPGTSDTDVLAGIVALRGALLLEAAASLARDGHPEVATTAADDAAAVLKLPTAARSLLRSNVYWVSGERDKAFAESAFDTTAARADDATENRILAALSLQRSELAMSLGKRDEARYAALRAERFASAANESSLLARSKWMLAALGEAKAEPPPKETLATPAPFPVMGFASPLEPWRADDPDKQRTRLDLALAPWVGLAAADPAVRRAGRWATLRSRGDAPPWLSVHLLLASRLLDPTEGDHEVFFDALLAFDQRRFSLRSYAFARAEAARMRGDGAAASTWDDRYRALRKLAADHAHIELTRHLDI